MKKNKKDAKIVVLTGPSREFHIHTDGGDGYQHEYTFKVHKSESGTYYSMEHSNSMAWPEEVRGVNVFHILNYGDGYEWIETKPMDKHLGYEDMFKYSVFMRVIQYVESDPRFGTKILEINEVESFNI